MNPVPHERDRRCGIAARRWRALRPSHAEEVGRGVPTAVVVARPQAGLVQQAFMNERFRIYTHDDVTGVELGGALKNVIAIAAGCCDGIGFGDNTAIRQRNQ